MVTITSTGLQLTGVFDSFTVAEFRKALNKVVEDRRSVEIDMTGVTSINAANLHVLNDFLKKARFKIKGASDAVKNSVAAFGMEIEIV